MPNARVCKKPNQRQDEKVSFAVQSSPVEVNALWA